LNISSSNLESVRRYLKAIEDGDFSPIRELFAPDASMVQFPNRIYPQGLSASVSQMSEAFEKGRKLLASQTYKIKNELVNGDSVAVEVLWIGKLAVPFGSMAAGSEMRAHSAMFFEFKEGKIVSQKNYDCFVPW
jgi:ketosteroid isomerase-like protein